MLSVKTKTKKRILSIRPLPKIYRLPGYQFNILFKGRSKGTFQTGDGLLNVVRTRLQVDMHAACYKNTFYHNRPHSYSQYWTGTSLQWRLMRGKLFKCK